MIGGIEAGPAADQRNVKTPGPVMAPVLIPMNRASEKAAQEILGRAIKAEAEFKSRKYWL
jgi:hypothetical protein